MPHLGVALKSVYKQRLGGPMLALISFIVFTLFVAGFAYYKTRAAHLEESSEGYFLGGRSLTTVFISVALCY